MTEIYNDQQNIVQNTNSPKSRYHSTQESYRAKVDLSKLDASEETMSFYTYPREFLKLDLDKIREFIEIFEEYYQNLLNEENMSQAKSVKQRLILLKNLEKEKMKREAKIIYSNQRELIEDKMNEELSMYIETTDSEFDSLLHAFESQEVEMLKTQKQEIDEYKNNFEKYYENKKPKPSKQMLNWMKIRDYAIKQNKFDKVEEAAKEIEKLQEIELEKFELDKEKKLNVELNKIIRRHENEKNALEMKKKNIIDMFNQTKLRNIEQIQKKYEAKMKELTNYQNFEMANFDKITKGITKPCARIQNIVSSTTGIQENDNDENEIKGVEEYDEEEEVEDENQKTVEENGKEQINENSKNQNNEQDGETKKQEIKNEQIEEESEHQKDDYGEEKDENVNEENEEENINEENVEN